MSKKQATTHAIERTSPIIEAIEGEPLDPLAFAVQPPADGGE